MDKKKLVCIAAVLFLAGGTIGFMFGRDKADGDHGTAIEQLRSELGRAGQSNRVLQADNDRLRAENRQLGKELEGANAAAEESYRIAEFLRESTGKTIGNLDAASKIVGRLRSLGREIREGDSAAQTKK